jgi:hypothetical protein
MAEEIGRLPYKYTYRNMETEMKPFKRARISSEVRD